MMCCRIPIVEIKGTGRLVLEDGNPDRNVIREARVPPEMESSKIAVELGPITTNQPVQVLFFRACCRAGTRQFIRRRLSILSFDSRFTIRMDFN